MKLHHLFEGLPTTSTWGDQEVAITGIQYDSRKVEPGNLFVALRGAKVDGHRYIKRAWEAGAAGVVAETPPGLEGEGKSWVHVSDSRQALGNVAAAFYGHPSRALKVAGVTGTNGKTTTTFLIQHLLSAAQRQCGLIGTVRYDTGGRLIESKHTTPESSDVHELLAEMVANQCQAVVMEASSHGIEQRRIEGVEFDAAVFTNLTQDHLDYHGSMNAYFAAKRRLFEGMNQQTGTKKPVMVVNGDDSFGERLLRENLPNLNALTYGVGLGRDFEASEVSITFEGTRFTLKAKGRSFLVRTPLIGQFNVYNVLAALATGSALGLNLRESITNIAEAPQVPGRMESVGDQIPFRVFVDYAHTPDALEKACVTLRELRPRRLITLFGCGGDRDRAKRPLMAKAASRHSDIVVLTSDNPRSEDPQQILKDASKGISGVSCTTIEDRQEAIAKVIDSAQAKDVILIAGKGHETYQEFADRTIDFDDRQVALYCIQDWKRENADRFEDA